MFWRFFIAASFVSSISLVTGYWLLTTILPSHAPRRDQRVQVVRRPFAAGYCLIPTAELARLNGARSRRALPFFQYGTKPGDPYGKINPFVLAPDGGSGVIGTLRDPCGGDIGWPDDVPTVALEVLSDCASATTYLL